MNEYNEIMKQYNAGYSKGNEDAPTMMYDEPKFSKHTSLKVQPPLQAFINTKKDGGRFTMDSQLGIKEGAEKGNSFYGPKPAPKQGERRYSQNVYNINYGKQQQYIR